MSRIPGRALLASALCLISCGDPGVVDPPGRSALIIVDLQYDFLPGGALPTEGGGQIVERINRLQAEGEFDLVVATQDWHPPHHMSFASTHPGRHPGDVIELDGRSQELWADHAIQGSAGAELVAELDASRIARVFQKGTDREVDSYSGFFDNDRRVDTGLAAYLRQHGVTRVYVVGLALDYCVKFTALDAQRLGFDTTLIVDATRAVNLQPDDGRCAVEAMKAAGVQVSNAASFLEPEVEERAGRGATPSP